MKVLKKSLLPLLLVVFFFSGCVAQKTIQDNNPGTTFLQKTEVMALFAGATTDGRSVVTYQVNGKINVLHKGENHTGTWKVDDLGNIIFKITEGPKIKVAVFQEGGKTFFWHTDNTKEELTFK